MADWTAPFTLPKYTTAEFRKLKADYIAKHGYTITMPGLFDIIKIPLETPMSDQEDRDWAAKRYNEFSEDRLFDIRRMKQKRKDKFLAMLGSPAPEVVNNVGALMTCIDDAQDALFTLASAGVLAMRFTPPPVAAILSLPTGVALTGANALNVVQSLGRQRLPSKASKRAWQKKTGVDPWSKKGRIKYARHLLKTFPVKASVIQALQTTNDIFGFGLALGPVLGFFIDAVAGPVRRIFGDRVVVDYPVPTYDEATGLAHRYLRNIPIYYYRGPHTPDEEIIGMMMAQWLSQVALYSGTKDIPGWENYQNLDQLEIKARKPTNRLTLEVIEEEGLDVDAITGWPHNSQPWALATDVANEYAAPAQEFFNTYMARHDKDWLGYIYKTLACDATFYTLAALEGEDQVEVDYTVPAKAASILLENRMYPDPEQPGEKTQELGTRLDWWETANISPSLRDILEFCHDREIGILDHTGQRTTIYAKTNEV